MLDTLLLSALIVGIISILLEILAYFIRQQFTRQLLYICIIFFVSFSSSVLLAYYFSVPALLLWMVTVYRIINAMRVLQGRTEEARSYQVTKRTSLVLVLIHIVSAVILYASVQANIETHVWLGIMLTLSCAMAIVLYLAVHKNLASAKIGQQNNQLAQADIPSVSVCIPARNETDDLSACLESLLASDYAKLEILVLDDCSHQQTSDIIKGFANKGVRFIHGDPVKKGWLAKNQAYKTLGETASSDVLLFCGVDVRVSPQTIRTLVETLHQQRVSMISILPTGLHGQKLSGLVQPMRYWWELVLPRRLFRRPPALSTAWVIKREALVHLGGFKAVKNTVVPESYFARGLAKEDAYGFVRSSGSLVVQSVKNTPALWEAAVRLRYPQLHKRLETVYIVSLAEIITLVLPFFMVVYGFFTSIGYLWPLAFVACALLFAVHIRVVNAWSGRSSLAMIMQLPFAILCELWLVQLSMYKYEFSQVEWKERNICIPVMHVIPRLPKA